MYSGVQHPPRKVLGFLYDQRCQVLTSLREGVQAGAVGSLREALARTPARRSMPKETASWRVLAGAQLALQRTIFFSTEQFEFQTSTV